MTMIMKIIPERGCEYKLDNYVLISTVIKFNLKTIIDGGNPLEYLLPEGLVTIN